MKVEQEFSELFTSDARVFTIIQEMAFVVSIGGSTLPYVHTQSTPSDLWTVNHNLGYRPVIEVLSDGGLVVEASVAHISNNQSQISFNTVQTGTVTAR
jgi:hypothetical protein